MEEPSCFRQRELTCPGMALPTFPRHAAFSRAFAGLIVDTVLPLSLLLYAISKAAWRDPFCRAPHRYCCRMRKPASNPIVLSCQETIIMRHAGFGAELLCDAGFAGIYSVRRLYLCGTHPKCLSFICVSRRSRRNLTVLKRRARRFSFQSGFSLPARNRRSSYLRSGPDGDRYCAGGARDCDG